MKKEVITYNILIAYITTFPIEIKNLINTSIFTSSLPIQKDRRGWGYKWTISHLFKKVDH